MKKFIFLFLILFIYQHGVSQDTLKQNNLDEVLIFSGKFLEKRKNIVQKVDVVTSKKIEQLNAQNTGDLLMQTGNVFVQKSQQGGSSPVIRGFEASRVLLVIDGIRMNNAIYRSGHLQNVITIDQNMLDRVEILYGPSSTLYGSDALGGVVHMRTKMPKLSTDGKMAVSGSSFIRYSSANNEKTVHADISMGGKKWGWLQSYNFSDFSDLKMGRKDHPDYSGFGRRNEYVERINGNDVIVQNPDNRVQKFSGYSQWDLTQKILFRQNDQLSHILNFQFSSSGNIPRYDRLQDRRNNNLRFAEWYYGPQKRILAGYEFNYRTKGWFDEFRTILSYQKIQESRHQRLFQSTLLDNRMEDLDVTALTADARKFQGNHELIFGIDAQNNRVKSTAFRKNIETGEKTSLDTRYPDGKNHMLLAGIFFQHLLKFGNGRWVLNDGIRLQTSTLSSVIRDNSFLNFPITEYTRKNFAVTGNLGIVFMPSQKWRLTTGISSGFRSPNIDDLGKIFESNSASRQLIIPNPEIESEYTYNTDLGVSFQAGKFRVEGGIFFTLFSNAIALAPFTLNNQDSVLYNGQRSAVFASQNINRGYINGFHFAGQAELKEGFIFSGSLNYTFGKLKPTGKSSIPMDHIPPLYGRVAFSYSLGKVETDLYALFNGWKRIEDYHPSGEDNAQYATSDGTPSWLTINWKFSYVIRNWVIQAGVENIMDRNYRLFASGFSAPGRNFIAALRYKF